MCGGITTFTVKYWKFGIQLFFSLLIMLVHTFKLSPRQIASHWCDLIRLIYNSFWKYISNLLASSSFPWPCLVDLSTCIALVAAFDVFFRVWMLIPLLFLSWLHKTKNNPKSDTYFRLQILNCAAWLTFRLWSQARRCLCWSVVRWCVEYPL